MAGALAGVTRSPLTAIVFTFELTHDTGSLLPLLVTCSIAHLLSTLILKRSILTEKVARKGFHVVREYAVDPLEALFVRDVMETQVITVSPGWTVNEAFETVVLEPGLLRQRLIPAVDPDGSVVGEVSLAELRHARDDGGGVGRVASIIHREVGLVHPDEPLRGVADRMAGEGVTTYFAVADASNELEGFIIVEHLLAGRQRQLVEERDKERPLRFRR